MKTRIGTAKFACTPVSTSQRWEMSKHPVGTRSGPGR